MYKNLCEGLRENVKLNTGVTIIENAKYEIYLSYKEIYNRALEQLYLFQSKGIKEKDELVIQIDKPQDFLSIFWGCILGGIIPVPITIGNTEEHKLKLIKIWKILNNPYLITNKKNMDNLNEYFSDLDDEKIDNEIKNKSILVEDILRDCKTENKGIEAGCASNDIAFIQFSSGSTGDPKGVVLTHENLLTNVNAIIKGLEMNEKDVILSWMPLTHDMGMIGCHITPLILGIDHVIISTNVFIKNPVLWMNKVNLHRATILTSPNFGLKYFLNFYKELNGNQWDLSCVKSIVNGAEPISSNVCNEFLSVLEKYGLKKECMFTVYGMAEASLAVSFPRVGEMFKTICLDRNCLNVGNSVKEVDENNENCVSFVDVGYPVQDCKIKICDNNGEEVKEEVVGDIYIKGKNVTGGYYNNVTATKLIIDDKGWLKTGDLGFIINDRLVITGRSKDIIFINGQNYYPYDIERVAEKVEGINMGQVVACGVQKDNKEELLVFVMFKKSITEFIDIAINIKKMINVSIGLDVNSIIPVKKIPKTTSGKVQRYKLANMYLDGEFDNEIKNVKAAIEESFLKNNFIVDSNDVEEVILNICKDVFKNNQISVNDNFFEWGINSLQLNLVTEKLEELYPGKISTTDLFAYPSIKRLVNYINKSKVKVNNEENVSKNINDRNDIAIIGIDVKFPMASNKEQYWDNIINGVDSIRKFPANRRKDIEAYLSFTGLSKEDIKFLKGGYLEEIDKFDYSLFKITPKEAMLMNPNQRLFLETAWKAIEDAGYSPKTMSESKTGVYVGYIGDTEGYKYKQMIHDLCKSQDSMATAGNLPSIIPSRISYFMDLKGPSILIDTACSSSLVAVHLACQGLINGDCDMALAGGVKISFFPLDGKEKLGMESSDGRAKTFDDSSDGTGFGEGVAAVLLKPLKKAIEDKDNIYAVIKGSATNQDGNSIGITAPNLLSQVDVIESACKNANVNMETISYIEAHGTGTRIGDRVEIEGISKAFKKYTNKKQFCAIGSVKTNIGHLFEVSGIAGLIKSTLALKYKLVPPTINFHKPNDEIDFESSPIFINDRLREWEREEYPRRCGISSFGFSGTNCHVILEEYENTTNKDEEKSSYIFTVSARSKKGLRNLIEIYREFLEKDCNIRDLCYTAANGRNHFNYRFATIVSNKDELKNILIEIIDDNYKFANSEKFFFGEYKVVSENKNKLEKNEVYYSQINKYTEECNEFIYKAHNTDEFEIQDLKHICENYVKGADIKWELLYEDCKPNRISIPFTAFERERCWVEVLDDFKINEDTYYKLAFKKKKLECAKDTLGEGDILIFKDNKGLNQQLINKFKEVGRNVIEVEIGETFKEINANKYIVGKEETDYIKLVECENIKNVTDIIHLSSLNNLEIVSIIELYQCQENGIYSLFNLFKAIAKNNVQNKITITLVVDHANSILSTELVIKPENAPVIALGKVLTKECDKIEIKSIDIDENTGVEEIYNAIIYQQEYRASYRCGMRYIEELVSVDIDDEIDVPVNIVNGGVYVITGGMGGIGFEIAKYIATKNNVVIAMLNRTTIPERRTWDEILKLGEDKKNCMKINLIKQIEESGSIVECVSADIANYDETKLAIDKLKQKYGKINGVIHGAGIAGNGYVEHKDKEVFTKVIEPKIYGTWIMNEVTKNDNLDFFIMLSSVATILTVQGQSDYAAGNAYMDSFAEYRRQHGKKGLSINWAQWKQVGMALENGANTDTIFKAIKTNTALCALDTVIRKDISRVIIGQLNFESNMIKILRKFPFEISDEINEKVNKIEKNIKNCEKFSETERKISEICMDVLGIKEVDVDQSFFDLGADSIMLSTFSSKLEKVFTDKVSVTKIFSNPTIAKLAQYIDSENKEGLITKGNNKIDSKCDIAVIGMATIMPGAKNVKEFWNNLKNSKDCIDDFPYLRKLYADKYLQYLDYDLNNIKYLKGGYLNDIDKFDSKFFRITPKEASLMDPNQRLFLQTAWSAIEDAGYGGSKIVGSNTGVYVGYANNYKASYGQMISEVEPQFESIAIAGNLAAIIPSRVSYTWDLKGPSIVVDTACSSSLVAIHLACNALKKGECDMAIAGGVKLNLIPLDNQIKIGIESSDYRTKAFDNSSDGTGIGEGVAVVVLKPLEKAIEDGDNIYAVVKGSAINQDGSSTGITAPNASAQTEVILNAWKDSGIDPETISYIEAHGTGTKLGDPIEIEGLTQAFRKYTSKTQFCAIGSVKTNIGHLFEASGVTSFVKAVLSLNHKEIVPSIHFNEPNSRINFKESPVYVNTSLTPWQPPNSIRRCGVSAFGLSGTNCHMILEEFSNKEEIFSSNENNYIFTLSSKSKESLIELVKEYVDILNTDMNIKNVCYTLNTGRGHYNHRIAFVVNNIYEIKVKLNEFININSEEHQSDFYGQHNVINGDVKKYKNGLTKNEVIKLSNEANSKLDEYIATGKNNIKLINEICKMYIKGANIQWETLYKDGNCVKISLPTYCFEKEINWINIPENQKHNVNDYGMYYSINYIEDKFSYEKQIFNLGTILVIRNNSSRCSELILKLKKECNVIEAYIGKEFVKIDNTIFSIRGNKEDYIRILKKFKVDEIINCVTLDEKELKEENELKTKLNWWLYSLVNLFNALGTVESNNSRIGFTLITECSEDVNNDSIIKPENAALIGLCKGRINQFNNVIIRCIDIDKESSIDTIYKSLLWKKEFLVFCRKEKIYLQEFDLLNLDGVKTNEITIKENGVYVITGGTGGIGLEIAKFLASINKVKIVLIGRNNVSPTAEWQNIINEGTDYKKCRVIRTIRELESNGSEIMCMAVDVSDLQTMSKAFKEIRKHYGNISGIIHSAGTLGYGEKWEKTDKEIHEIVSPKIIGTWILNKITENDELDFLILCSSISTVFSGPKQSEYVAANSYMDSYSYYRNNRGKRTVSIDWPIWKEVGMAADNGMDIDTLFKAIPKAKAITVIDKILNKNVSRIIIGEINENRSSEAWNKNKTIAISNKLNELIVNINKTKEKNVVNKNIIKDVSQSNGGNSYKEIERKIATICMEVLGVRELDIDENFLDLGADSILLSIMVDKLQQLYPNKVSVAKIFAYSSIKSLAGYIYEEEKELPNKKSEFNNCNKNDIAVIGMSCKLPNANNTEELWKCLIEGKDCITTIPNSRKKDVDNYIKFSNLNEGELKYLEGAYLDEIDKFDYKFFKITPKEASLMDPNQRLFLETAWQAIEDAGYGGKRISGSKTGVYVGFSSNFKDCYGRMVSEVDSKLMSIAIPGNLPSIIPSRISYVLNLKGPSLLVDTACSSSLVAIHLACSSLRKNECDMAIAGGIKLNLLPINGQFNLGIESSDGKTKSFDNNSDGTGIGEGVAAVILKPLNKAIEDNDNIYAVIKGTAINQDGASTGITAPNVESQTLVIQSAWEDAKIDPETISYIEAHGTGTKLGDPIEIEGLTEAFRKYTDKKQFCALGSLKTNMGHLFEAAGIAGFIKAVLSLSNKKLPPMIHFDSPNKIIDFENSPVYVNDRLTEWIKGNFPRRCGVSSFGFSGTNCHVVLEEAPDYKCTVKNNIKLNVLILSAKSKESLRKLVKKYCELLKKDIDIDEVCYTANTGREHYNYRLALIGKNKKEFENNFTILASLGSDFSKVNNNQLLNSDCVLFGENFRKSDALKNKEYIDDDNKIYNLINTYLNAEEQEINTLSELCSYFVNGGEVDWRRLYSDEDIRKVSLPTYPFEKTRCWIETSDDRKEDYNSDNLFHLLSFKENPLVVNGKIIKNKTILVFKDLEGKADKLIKYLISNNNKVIQIIQGDKFEIIDSENYLIGNNEDDYTKLIKLVKDENISDIIHMSSIKSKKIYSLEELKQCESYGVYSLFYLNKAIAKNNVKNNIRILVISEYVNSVTGEEKFIKPENASLFALGKSMSKENPNINVVCVDIDLDTSMESVFEAFNFQKEYRTFYRKGHRYIEELNILDIEEKDDDKLEIKKNGVYIITGGMGGIGLEICEYLAKCNNVILALINRTKLPEEDKWNQIINDGNDLDLCRRLKKIKDIEASGSKVLCLSADISNYSEVKSIIDDLRQKHGSINGVIHAAGVAGDGYLVRKDEIVFTNVLKPKIEGTWILDKITERDNLDFFVLFSSVATTLTVQGQGDYAAANSYLDSFAEYRSKKGKKTVAINWVSWKEVGMAANYGVNTDTIFKAIYTNTAISAFDKVINKNINRVLIGQLNFDSSIIYMLEKFPFELSSILKEKIKDSKKKIELEEQSTKTQRIISKVCSEVLGVDNIDVNESFLDIGADSIILHELCNRLDKLFPGKVSVTKIFMYPSIEKLSNYIDGLESTGKETIKSYTSNNNSNRDVAIIGMAAKMPNAKNINEYWNNLKNNKDCIKSLPIQRKADADKYLDYTGINVCDIRYLDGGYIEDIDKFDYKFFGITHKDATLMDPNQRVFLETAVAAIEDAGYGGSKIVGSNTGLYVGYGNNFISNYGSMIDTLDPESLSISLPGNISAIIPSRVSYILDLKGPSMMVDTACSSSLLSVHLACNALRNGECDMALAGGIKLNLLPIEGYVKLGIESSDSRTRAFDSLADGTGIGEGVGVVVLKDLEKALSDKDNIYAVIKGSAVNQDGKSASLTSPNAMAQKEVIVNSWKDAGINPETISYIEAHGTGTKLGDPIEIDGITEAFRTFTNKKQFCAIGSVKANVGHLYEAAGIAGLIKLVMSLKNKELLALKHFEKPNDNIDFENSPVYVNTQNRLWESDDNNMRRCGISAFGFSGTNCHIVLEEAPQNKKDTKNNSKKINVLTLSAKSYEALKLLINEYINHVDEFMDIEDICYTANTGRGHYEYRIAIIVNDRTEFLSTLRSMKDKNIHQIKEENVYAGTSKIVSSIDKIKNAGEITIEDMKVISKKANNKIVEFKESYSLNLELIKQICEFYVKGANIKWDKMYEGGTNNKVSLPTYPFERQRCWINVPKNNQNQIDILNNVYKLLNKSDIPKELASELKLVSSKLEELLEKCKEYIACDSSEDDEERVILKGRDTEKYSATEIKIAKVWRSVLGIEQIDINDNYFEIGGDSIKAIQIASYLQEVDDIKVKVDVNDLLNYQTIESLAFYIDNVFQVDEEIEACDELNITPMQNYIFEKIKNHEESYKFAVLTYKTSRLNEYVIQMVFEELMRKYNVLNVDFKFNGEIKAQWNKDINTKFELEIIDLISVDEFKHEIDREIQNLQLPIEISNMSNIKGKLFKTKDEDYLFIILSPLISDKASISILINDFIEAYLSFGSYESKEWDNSNNLFKIWSNALIDIKKNKNYADEIKYLANIEELNIEALPKDKNDNAKEESLFDKVQDEISKEETELLLNEVHKAYNTEIKDILLTSLALAVEQSFSRTNLVIDICETSRNNMVTGIDVKNTIGVFDYIYPIYMDISEENDIAYRLKIVKEYIRRVPNEGLGLWLLKFDSKYIEDKEYDTKLLNINPDVALSYNFDKSITSINGFEVIHKSLDAKSKMIFDHNIELSLFIKDFKLQIQIKFNKGIYNEDTIVYFAENYKDNLLELISHCMNKEGIELTPSDFDNEDLSIKEIEDIFSLYEEE